MAHNPPRSKEAASRVLAALTAMPAGVTGLRRRTGLPRAAIHRALDALEASGRARTAMVGGTRAAWREGAGRRKSPVRRRKAE